MYTRYDAAYDEYMDEKDALEAEREAERIDYLQPVDNEPQVRCTNYEHCGFEGFWLELKNDVCPVCECDVAAVPVW